MELYVTVRTAKTLIKLLADQADLLETQEWQYQNKKANDKVKIKLDSLSLEGLIVVRDAMKEGDEDDTPKVSKLINALKNTDNKPVSTLQEFPRFLTQYLKDNDNPLLHSLHADLRGVAYLPIEVKCCEPERGYNGNRDPWVTIILGYNTEMRYRQYSVTLRKSDMRASVPEILRKHNLMVPDETMTAEYVKIQARYVEFSVLQAEQFWCKGSAPIVGDNDYWWHSRSEDISLTHMGKPTKAVLDIEGIRDRDNTAKNGAHSEIYNARRLVPQHPVLPMFSMAHHKTVWVNVVNMRKYKYEEGLKDKLVLPKSHLRLIGALVSNLDALRTENEAEDKSRTIQAKASASIILAKGPAGTGKTLTAEVYAEEIQRPLYEVQSGQIGTAPEEIEENMNVILNRSIRLRMPLLINEADVFIQARGRDLIQNAVVSVFLRLLEYHNGLVFLTTNRSDDIDDAILSRCIAEIQYGVPAPSERLKLWQVMLSEFNVELSKSEVRKAVLLFPEVVGRDIQNLIRLTHRVCKAVGDKFTLEALCENAVFKSIKCLTEEELAAEITRRALVKENRDKNET